MASFSKWVEDYFLGCDHLSSIFFVSVRTDGQRGLRDLFWCPLGGVAECLADLSRLRWLLCWNQKLSFHGMGKFLHVNVLWMKIVLFVWTASLFLLKFPLHWRYLALPFSPFQSASPWGIKTATAAKTPSQVVAAELEDFVWIRDGACDSKV